ncbi:hypothetical protein ACOME3_010298 [Neoechinorhynchus agilis]
MQISLWLHWFPEILYLEQGIFVTKGEPKRKPLFLATSFTFLYLAFIVCGYVLNEWSLTLAILIIQYIFDSGMHNLGQVLYLTQIDAGKTLLNVWSGVGFLIARVATIALLIRKYFDLYKFPTARDNSIKLAMVTCIALVQIIIIIHFLFNTYWKNAWSDRRVNLSVKSEKHIQKKKKK